LFKQKLEVRTKSHSRVASLFLRNNFVDYFLFLLTRIQDPHGSIYPNMKETKTNLDQGKSSYAQLFVFRVPKKNHEAMHNLEQRLVPMWKKHGIIDSEFFQLTQHETVKGFTNLTETVSAGEDEEVWVEIQRYRNREHRDEIFATIRKDMPMLELFGQWYGLVTPGKNSVMGDFNKLKI
jgi:uncharacterized protein YbaA (DUF1428 family)